MQYDNICIVKCILLLQVHVIFWLLIGVCITVYVVCCVCNLYCTHASSPSVSAIACSFQRASRPSALHTGEVRVASSFILDVSEMISLAYSKYLHTGVAKSFWVPAHGFSVDNLQMTAPSTYKWKLPIVIYNRLLKQSGTDWVAYKQQKLICLQFWRLRNPDQGAHGSNIH